MFSSTSREALKRAPTPHDDSDSEEEEEPEDKDPFGSFGIRSSRTARGKEPCRPRGTRDDPFTFGNLLDNNKDDDKA